MAEEIDDNGFYREDFSAESDWEIFNAQLCELFQKWELANTDWQRTFEKDELYKCNWIIEEEVLEIKGKRITVAYYRAQLKPQDIGKSETTKTSSMAAMHEDLLSLANTFGPPVLDEKSKDLHWLARFYGLRRFVVVNPTSEQSFITKRSEFSFYLSAVSVVAAEVCSSVPVFVQIYDHKWNFFLGVGITSYMRTNFDLVALEQPPQEYCYLSGILNMFKEKLPKQCKQPALVSIRNTYALDTVKIRVPMYVPFGMTPIVDEERSIISVSYFNALPHGFFPDSRTDMFAIFTWPELTDSMVIDSMHQTQFVPSKAPCGSIYQAVHATSYLSSCLKLYHDLIKAKQTLESYVGQNFSGTTSPSDVAKPLDQLTKSNLSKFHAQRSGVKKSDDTTQPQQQPPPPLKKLSGPMNEYELNQMLYYLFPDMHPEVALFPYEIKDNKIDPHRIKSAVADSLVHRLSCLLGTCHAHFGGKSGMAQLWATFTRELRFLWDSCITIPGVAAGYPDTRTCLLHQKLQMLNVCMERRQQREQGITPKPKLADATDVLTDDEEDDNDTEEEFYDCDEEEAKRLSPIKGVVATKPEGRLKRLRDLKLLDSEEYLYIPITQEPVPKTEDELQDEADVMLKLGTSSDHVTTMMCSTLLSDTEAFKAANLNAKFEDFIRWYSPNDWEEYTDDEGGKAHKLSPRMMAEGNTWQTVWEQAKPVPITRQKRLFDDTYEGFKILSYLETRNLGEIYGLTVVPLLQSAVLKLKNIFINSHVLELFNESSDEILADLSRFSRDIEIVSASSEEPKYILQLPNPLPITKKIENLEMHFYQYKCFERMPAIADMNMTDIQAKFKEMLKNNGCCNISSKHLDLEGKQTSLEERLLSSFRHDMSDRLISKDYVIRMGEGLTEKPELDAADSTKTIMPQFLRAIVTGEKLRLCGAFTENTTFLE